MPLVIRDYHRSGYISRTLKCGFCSSTHMERKTATCKDCGTTNPGYNAILKRERKKKVEAESGTKD